MSTLNDFVTEAKERLAPSRGYRESDTAYFLRCPGGRCGDDANLMLSRINGSGYCAVEPLPTVGGFRRYSPREIAELQGMDVLGLYGGPVGPQAISLFQEGSSVPAGSLWGLRTDHSDIEKTARELLEDPQILQRFVVLASDSGIAGEADLLRVLLLVATSRLLKQNRLHASLGEESGSGKSTEAKYVLSTLPPATVLHFGGGASKRAFQYYGDLSGKVVFIDESDELDPELRAFLREATTRPTVTRLVTEGDPSSGFRAHSYTVRTEGMVLIQAGTKVITDPADETRMLLLHPDASVDQTGRILDKQAVDAEQFRPAPAGELKVWCKAQELLNPCHVIVPYAKQLRQFFPSDIIRVRRDFPRVLGLIGAHACLHQYQRSCYEQDGVLVVQAELEDYVRLYEFAATLFNQATKRLTPTQEQVLGTLIKNRGIGGSFVAHQAAAWVKRAYPTVMDHLKALESLGSLTAHRDKISIIWTVIASTPRAITLPSPADLFNAVYPKTPQPEGLPVSAQVGPFMGSAPVTDPQTPKGLAAEQDVAEA